jgi:hypothetical protein
MVELRPPKIELFSVVFSQRATECNWATGNRKISPLLPVRPTHVTALLSLVFVLPYTATAILHRTPPPPPQPVLLLRASRSPPPSGSGHHPSPMPLPPCSRTATGLHMPPPSAPPLVAWHPSRHLLQLPSAEGHCSSIRRGASSGCNTPRPLLRRPRRPLLRAASPPVCAGQCPLPAARSPQSASHPLSAAACSPLSREVTPPTLNP